MKNIQKKYTIFIVIIILLIIFILGFIYFKKDKLDLAIDNIKGINNIDKNKEICVEMHNNKNKSIDCFTPNKIKEYMMKYSYSTDDILTMLSGSNVTNDKVLKFEEEPLFYQIYDMIQPNITNISNITTTYNEIKKKLELHVKKANGVLDEYLAYYYLKNLEGNYKEANDIKNNICVKFKYLCKDDLVYLNISGKILDENKKPISGVIIKIAGTNKYIKSQDNGIYYLSEYITPYTKIRLLATKDSYSDGVVDVDVITPVKKQSFEKNFVLNKSSNQIKINTKANIIEGKNTKKDNKYFYIKTDWSEYKIPLNAIVYENGDKYIGNLKAYTWEFNKNSDVSSLINSSIFDEVAGYAGDLMKTFGMPYILFISDKGEKLHILKSNPMILTTRIQEMKALETNKDKIYEPLTKHDLEFLVKKSNELGGHPIDRLFLSNNNILRFPAFWVFDQYKGIWVNEGMKVLNTDGDSEILFYTTSYNYK